MKLQIVSDQKSFDIGWNGISQCNKTPEANGYYCFQQGAQMISVLSVKQQKAMVALLDGKNNEEAANIAGVEVRTIYRWKKEPAFRREIAISVAILQSDALLTLGINEKQAIETIITTAKNGVSEPVRLRAAVLLLELLNSYRERAETIHYSLKDLRVPQSDLLHDIF